MVKVKLYNITTHVFKEHVNWIDKFSWLKFYQINLIGFQESPKESSHLENFHPSNSSMVNSPRKTLTQKIPIRNIFSHVFKHFVFSLLSTLLLILL